ncbi:unnamed protein product [Amoebophrya sp. A25]|nr:unnamed protein product [Amoebophrya sp. A25]|eukprot:GSA25T00027734001.1
MSAFSTMLVLMICPSCSSAHSDSSLLIHAFTPIIAILTKDYLPYLVFIFLLLKIKMQPFLPSCQCSSSQNYNQYLRHVSIMFHVAPPSKTQYISSLPRVSIP